MAQPTNMSWPGFAACNGKLTVVDTFRTLNSGQIQRAQSNLRNWLDQIRLHPENFGFSSEFQGPVIRLLDTFFPSTGRVRRFSTGRPPLLQSGPAVALPVMVPYGNGQDGQMSIVDGPSAMGYIFSVASPPHGLNSGWWNCFLPLNILYSWAMYLADIRFICGSPLPRRDVYWVPYMTCLMYVERSDRPPLSFLGHPKAMASKKSPGWAVDEKENRLCLDYRAQMIYNAAELGSPSLPLAAENWPARMREALIETLPGEKASLVPMEEFRKELFAGLAKNETIERVLPAGE